MCVIRNASAGKTVPKKIVCIKEQLQQERQDEASSVLASDSGSKSDEGENERAWPEQ